MDRLQKDFIQVSGCVDWTFLAAKEEQEIIGVSLLKGNRKGHC